MVCQSSERLYHPEASDRPDNVHYQCTSAQLAADTAKNAAQAATPDLQTKGADLREFGGDLVRLIKAYAESQADPAPTYVLADITPPAPASPLGPPAVPT